MRANLIQTKGWTCCNALRDVSTLTLKERIGKNLRWPTKLLFQADKLHVEYEGGIGGDDARVTFAPIGKVRSAGQLCTLSYAHLQKQRRADVLG